MTEANAKPARRQMISSAVLTLLAAAVLLTAAASEASAQSKRKLNKGDDVQVRFLNKWWDGQVVDTNARGDVLAEFQFAGRAKQQAFKRREVRFLYEANALAPGRTWSDESGSFKILAALLAINSKTVTLRKEDMSEIQVPIARLSTSDQAFIKRKEKEFGPAAASAPEPPPTEKFQVTEGVFSDAFAAGGANRTALAPDPLPSFFKLEEGGVAFGMRHAHDRMGAVIPLGGADSWLLVAVENHGPTKKLPTQLLWASLSKKKIEATQLLPAGEIVLDYHQRSHRLLTYAVSKEDVFSKQPMLTLWESLPSKKEVVPIVRWESASGERAPNEPWARLVNGNIVLHRWSENEIVAWDVEAKAMRYRVKQEAFFSRASTLSGGRRYLFLPEDKRVRILEAATGRLACTLPAKDGAAAVAVTDDGRRLAVLSRSALTVWDLTDAQAEPLQYQAEAIGTPFGTTIAWVGDQRIMADSGPRGQVLFSLKHRVAIWNYQFDFSAIDDHLGGRRLREISNSHLVYAASVRSGSDRGLAVGAVQLPGPKVDEATASLDLDSLMILKRGSSVRLEIKAGQYASRVEKALRKEIEANGWTVSPDAAVTLVAEMKRGKQQTVTYRMTDGTEQSASVTPYISWLQLRVGKQLAWATAGGSGAPFFVEVRKGETVQSIVDKNQRPNPELFEKIDIPERISDPAKRLGFGVTKVTSRGLVVEE